MVTSPPNGNSAKDKERPGLWAIVKSNDASSPHGDPPFAAAHILHEGMRIYRNTLSDTLVAVGQTETINGRGAGVRLSEPLGSYATDGEAFTSYWIPLVSQVC